MTTEGSKRLRLAYGRRRRAVEGRGGNIVYLPIQYVLHTYTYNLMYMRLSNLCTTLVLCAHVACSKDTVAEISNNVQNSGKW